MKTYFRRSDGAIEFVESICPIPPHTTPVYLIDGVFTDSPVVDTPNIPSIDNVDDIVIPDVSTMEVPPPPRRRKQN